MTTPDYMDLFDQLVDMELEALLEDSPEDDPLELVEQARERAYALVHAAEDLRKGD